MQVAQLVFGVVGILGAEEQMFTVNVDLYITYTAPRRSQSASYHPFIAMI